MAEVAQEFIDEQDAAMVGEMAGEAVSVDAEESVSGDTELVKQDISDEIRIVEALLFAATEPVSTDFLAERLPEGTDIGG
jgi:segregation and condensation protein B